MSHYLNKTIIYLLLGSAAFVGTVALVILVNKPIAYGQDCGKDCKMESYPVSVPYDACRTETVPITHYYNTTRQVKQYYSYEACTAGACKTVSGWYWDRNNKGKLYKHYYSRQECEPQSCRTVSGWRWVEEPIKASYITWKPREVCETKYRTETQRREVCTPKKCPPAPTPDLQGSQCSYSGKSTCVVPFNLNKLGNQYHTCSKPEFDFATFSFISKWGQTITCPGTQVCIDTKKGATCTSPPKTTNVPRAEAQGCISLSAGYGTGSGAPAKLDPVGENQTFWLKWNWMPGGLCGDGSGWTCQRWGTWQGHSATPQGGLVPWSFSGTAAANYTGSGLGKGWHNFAIGCSWDGRNWVQMSNTAYVHFVLGTQQPPPPEKTICTSECSPGQTQCVNNEQWKSCLDTDPGPGTCYKWSASPIYCISGAHCSGEQCIDDKTGEPRMPNGDKTKADEKEIDWDKLLKELNKTDTGTDGTGGTGGAGFPAFGSTQCYDGKDNDNDRKIDNGVTKVENGVKKYYPPDPGCQDKDGRYNPNDNSEFQYRIKEVIPDFFNLNWFKLDFVNFFQAEALAQR